MATYPLPRQIRRPRSTSTSSAPSALSSLSSSFSPYPFQTPFSPSSYALIPFKWERTPGIPKTPLNKSLNPRRVPALPPPLRSNSEKVARVADPDPFAAAILECVKDPVVKEAAVNGGGRWRRIGLGFGWRRIGLGFGLGFGSCKTSCAVSESTRVLNPRPAVGVSRFGCESAMATCSNNKGRTYTSNEDGILSQSWVSITQDPLTGNDQSGTQFWDRVFKQFETLIGTPTDRTAGYLSSRFCAIAKSVSLFIAKLNSVTNRAASGTTEADKLREARVEYMQSSGKAFKFEECYEVLKDHPKFSLPTTHVFESDRSSQSGEEGSTIRTPAMQDWESNIPTDLDLPPALFRPPGRKAEKRKGKRLIESAQFSEMVIQTRTFNNIFKESSDRMTVITEMKLALKQKEHEMKQEEHEMRKRREEDRIMSLDIMNLPESERHYFMCRQREIMQSRGYN